MTTPEPIKGIKIDVAFVGSCTNGRLSDFREVAKFLKGNKSIFPPNLAWDADMPVKPGPDGIYPRAVPGQFKPV